MTSRGKGKSGKGDDPSRTPPVPARSNVQAAAAVVVHTAGVVRQAIADLAVARSQTSELTSEDWEAIQEANIALGTVPRPG